MVCQHYLPVTFTILSVINLMQVSVTFHFSGWEVLAFSITLQLR